MTDDEIRDQFAKAALGAMLTLTGEVSAQFYQEAARIGWSVEAFIAHRCYIFADAMLAERAKRRGAAPAGEDPVWDDHDRLCKIRRVCEWAIPWVASLIKEKGTPA